MPRRLPVQSPAPSACGAVPQPISSSSGGVLEAALAPARQKKQRPSREKRRHASAILGQGATLKAMKVVLPQRGLAGNSSSGCAGRQAQGEAAPPLAHAVRSVVPARRASSRHAAPCSPSLKALRPALSCPALLPLLLVCHQGRAMQSTAAHCPQRSAVQRSLPGLPAWLSASLCSPRWAAPRLKCSAPRPSAPLHTRPGCASGTGCPCGSGGGSGQGGHSCTWGCHWLSGS